MAAKPFAFPKSSTPGARAGEGEGRYMNCYPVSEGDRGYVRRVPGLASLAATGKTLLRGILNVNGSFYAVWNGSVTVTTDGVTTTLTGTVPGTDGVTLARNNKVTGGVSTPDIVAVRESGGAYVLTSTTVSAYPDADLPETVNSVDFMGGYFLFSIPDGRLFASELNSTDINALSFTTAESRADGLRRIVVRGNIAYALGASTVEPYVNVGTSPFPLQRAATVLSVGLLTTMAVSGAEEAWNNPIFFVSSDKVVKAMSGYEAATVSTADVERFIAASAVSTIETLVYTDNGRPYFAISSDAGTWVLDVTASTWHERVSAGASRWRASRSVYGTDQWIFGDTSSGDLLGLTSTLTEKGTELGGFVQSGQLKAFPARVATKLVADFTEADITIFVSWSHDGGKTWSTELQRSIENADRWPPSVANLGLSTQHGIIVKFRWTGAADFSFGGAVADRLDVRRT